MRKNTKSFSVRPMYMLRCYNGMYAAHREKMRTDVGDNVFRLEFHTLDKDSIFVHHWFLSESREQAVRYRDENNRLMSAASRGFMLEVVKVEARFSVTPGTIEFDREHEERKGDGK